MHLDLVRRWAVTVFACLAFASPVARRFGEPGDAGKLEEAAEGAKESGWFAFAPAPDPLNATSPIDLRWLNEKQAGDGGFIAAKGGQFVHSRGGKPLRFWAVNGPPDSLKEPEQLRHCARILAKYGVNLVRIHMPYFDGNGDIDPAKVQHAIDIVEAMASEGIYCDFSIYWYGFFQPKPNTPWLPGYDGKQAPVAVLYFYPEFQKKYFSWWRALLTTPGKTSGRRLIDNPAVACVEACNEDSYFFWSFSDRNIPDPEMRVLEKQFGDWLVRKYGSLDAARKSWNGISTPRDNAAEGRMGFRPLWNMAHERTRRDKDAAAFLVQNQRNFYGQVRRVLREMGFKGVMTGSNWTTADPQYLGPLDKYSYTICDYVDRHGYFGCARHGPNDGWAVMNDQTYIDRSALRFDPEEAGKPKDFNNPVIDVHYDGKPSMISETSFERPSRYRSEAPLYYACYGALQDSNGIVQFALDTDRWTVKPGYFMQPWTLMSPGTVGQYPVAALIFRQGLVSVGGELVHLNLKIAEIEDLQGTPMPQDASFDVLRARDVPQGTTLKPGNVIDPLVHYAGRTGVTFSVEGGPAKLADLRPLIDRQAQTVISSTGELRLDYGKGILRIDAPRAQGVSGDLKDAGTTDLKDLTVESSMPLGHIVAVSLDGKPLASSGRILLQVMSEEQNNNWKTEPENESVKKVTDIGQDPWMVKDISGTVKFKRPDAGRLKVTALDLNGYPEKPLGAAVEIRLAPTTVYYLIER